MARPKKADELKASATIGVRVTPELRAKLDAMAKANGRSVTDEARAALEKHTGLKGKRK
jgi:predicted transcriptional regulator